MKLASENLVIVTRPNSNGRLDVLTGEKQRGLFAGKRVFPGGKAEGTELQEDAAKRELKEEAGIEVATLRKLGRLVVFDERLGQERFGNIWLYGAHVSAETEELVSRWDSVDDEAFTDNMPADVEIWWPVVRDSLETNQAEEVIVHIQHDTEGTGHVVVKRPDIAQEPGEILRQEKLG